VTDKTFKVKNSMLPGAYWKMLLY